MQNIIQHVGIEITQKIFKNLLLNDNLFACNKFSTSLTYNAITCFVIIIILHFVNFPLCTLKTFINLSIQFME